MALHVCLEVLLKFTCMGELGAHLVNAGASGQKMPFLCVVNFTKWTSYF